MRTRYLNILLLIVLILSVVSAFGCDCNGCGKAVDKDETYIELDYFTYEVDLLDDFTFIAKTNAKAEDIEWSSSDESVATVSQGKITPVSIGETVITAKVDGKTASCYLRVVNNNYIPILEVSADSLKLISGDEYALQVSLQYLGKYQEDVIYAFTSFNENVATVDGNGLVKALTNGTTRIKVQAQFKHVDKDFITEYVDVQVVNDISLKFNANKYSMYAVSEINGVPYGNTSAVNCVAYDAANELDIPITLEIEDTTICDVSNGIVTGKKAGTTRIVASIEYDGVEYSDSAEINVVCALVENENELFISKLDPDISHAFSENTEISKIVLYNGVNKNEIKVNDNKIKGAADLPLGKVKVEVYGDKFAYSFANAEVVDLCITKPEHVGFMRAQTSGYFILGKDIDMQDVTNDVYANTFTGTFDGRGYEIKNLKFNTTNASLFYRFSGIIKNVALTNVKLSGGVQSGAIAVWAKGATVDGVYVSLSFGQSNHSGGLFKHVEAGLTKVNKSLIQITSDMTNNSGLLFGFGYSSGKVNLTGTYVIKKQSDATLVGARGGSYETFRDGVNALDSALSPISYTLDDFKTAFNGGTLNFDDYSLAVRNSNVLDDLSPKIPDYQDDCFES